MTDEDYLDDNDLEKILQHTRDDAPPGVVAGYVTRLVDTLRYEREERQSSAWERDEMDF